MECVRDAAWARRSAQSPAQAFEGDGSSAADCLWAGSRAPSPWSPAAPTLKHSRHAARSGMLAVPGGSVGHGRGWPEAGGMAQPQLLPSTLGCLSRVMMAASCGRQVRRQRQARPAWASSTQNSSRTAPALHLPRHVDASTERQHAGRLRWGHEKERGAGAHVLQRSKHRAVRGHHSFRGVGALPALYQYFDRHLRAEEQGAGEHAVSIRGPCRVFQAKLPGAETRKAPHRRPPTPAEARVRVQCSLSSLPPHLGALPAR